LTDSHLSRLFDQVRAVPASQRADWIAENCQDGDQRQQLERLVTQIESQPPTQTDGTAVAPHLLLGKPPDQIGPYQVLRELGSGGMGVVYLALQERPRRKVALKLLQRSSLRGEAEARFKLEAELLGRLQHPGIAQVFESGSLGDDDNSPRYIAMEYVEGTVLNAYAEGQNLDVESRIRLLEDIAAAVHHAHLRSVVHRDLKPDNILVGRDGQAKVIDFGVARFLDHEQTLQTQTGQIIGTLSYMSPEQVQGRLDEIDATSDVYALGVVSYELLSGSLPFSFQGCSIGQVAQKICEGRCPPMSKWNPNLRGDLDQIVAKAMAVEASRRYESAAAFAADLRRFLEHEPVTARAPSAVYYARRFVRRHRAVTAVAAAALVVVFGLMVWALLERGVAVEAAARANLEAEKARRRGEQAMHVSDFLQDLFHAPVWEVNHELPAVPTLRELLDRAQLKLDSELVEEPFVRGQLMSSLAEGFSSLGEHARGVGLAEEGLRQIESVVGEQAEESLAARLTLANVSIYADQLSEGKRNLERVLAELESQTPRNEPLLLTTQRLLGLASWREGSFSEAEEWVQKVLRKLEEEHGPRSPRVASHSSLLIRLHRARGRYAESLQVANHCHDILKEAFGAEHRQVFLAMREQAISLTIMDRFEEAEGLLRRITARFEQDFGELHSMTLQIRVELGNCLRKLGKLTEAESQLRLVLKGAELIRSGPLFVASTKESLAGVLMDARQPEEALKLLQRALQLYEDVFPVANPTQARCLNQIGRARVDLGEYSAAIENFEKALETYRATDGIEHPGVLVSLGNLAVAYRIVGRRTEALQVLEGVFESVRERYGDHHHVTVSTARDLGQLYGELGRIEEAEPMYLLLWEAGIGFPNENPGEDQLRAEAKRYFEALSEHLAAKHGHDHPRLLATRRVVALQSAEEDWEAAETLLLQLLDQSRETSAESSDLTLQLLEDLARLYVSHELWDQGLEWALQLEEAVAEDEPALARVEALINEISEHTDG
jgi:tetratricopeptide (TPR) repeat protein/predicted Ser/Thr protein kinase